MADEDLGAAVVLPCDDSAAVGEGVVDVDAVVVVAGIQNAGAVGGGIDCVGPTWQNGYYGVFCSASTYCTT